MRGSIVAVAASSLALVLSLTPVLAAETRCGWYWNPTPGNLWLLDKDATWTITSQGDADGAGAKGIENAPEFDDKQFVETNNPGSGYGYGCACMSVTTDKATESITQIFSGQIKPLATCEGDKSLPKPQD